MKRSEQLRRWVSGEPVHNAERDECTPDFSCCQGKGSMVPQPERAEFAAAFEAGDREKCDSMLMAFLRKLLNAEFKDVDVHVAGFRYGAKGGSL